MLKPASALEDVRDLADGEGMSVGVVDGNLSNIIHRVKADAFQINVSDGGFWLLDVHQLLCDEVLGLV